MDEPERLEGEIFPPPLPCPFCGEAPQYGTSENGKIVDFICCGECGVEFANKRMACSECGEAVDDPLVAWQRRAGLSPIARTEIERAELDFMAAAAALATARRLALKSGASGAALDPLVQFAEDFDMAFGRVVLATTTEGK